MLSSLGIEPVAVSEAVGKNLQDHPFCPVMGLLKEDTEHVGVRAELKFTTEVSGGLVDDMMLSAPCSTRRRSTWTSTRAG